MDELNTDRVRAFLEVAHLGSITAAAKKLGLTQPGLSRRIKTLEDELGVALLERRAHSISLTAAGRTLEKDGKKWMAMAQQIYRRVQSVGLGKLLQIGYAPTLAGPILGPALECFTQLHPGVRVQLADLSTTEMYEQLSEGKLDFIITVRDEEQPAIQWQKLHERAWRLAVAASHSFAKRAEGENSAVSVKELVKERLLMFSRDDYPEYWQQIGDYFAAQDVSPPVVGEFDGFYSLSMAVEAGIGVAVVAAERLGEASSNAAIRFLPLDPEPSPICIALGYYRELNPAARQLAEEIKRTAAEEVRRGVI